MANVPRTARTHEEIKAANEAYLKTKGVTNTPSAQQAQVTGASPSTAYTGGHNPVTGQVLSGVGSNRFNEAVAANRAINRQRAQYTNDPALAAYQKPITAYDSRSAEGQRLRNPLVAEAAMQEHARQANRGLPNAALTMIPGHGSPYGLSPMRANQVPAQVTSPAPVAINQAPIAPTVATLPSVPNQFNRNMGQGNVNLVPNQVPAQGTSLAPVALNQAPYPAEWLPETLEDQVSNTLRAVPGTLMAGARNVGKWWSAWRSNDRKKKAAYAQRKK